MKIQEFRNLIREEVKKVLRESVSFANEATSDTILYKVHFKPEYSDQNDSSNTPIKPVFVQMNTGERTKISNYAAVDKIGGYGKKTPDQLLAKDRIDVTEMTFAELFKLIKRLHRVKIYK